ncbi:MAG: DNA polymerase III subunit delta' [Gammaproteobacteria bacterium]|nr:DNA polymerase III subunit delta' [Gammaproteobacteria bacterium]
MTAASAQLPWHAEPWRRLQDGRRSGRLPHALLLAGPAGLGKSVFAARLARALVCPSPGGGGDACDACAACRQSAAGSHPDLLQVVPEAPGKAIRIDAIRQVTAKSVLAAQQDGYRVIVIDPADAMNRAAANALLKTLEEPTPRTLLLLVSSQPERLPATIRSRCQAVVFRPPRLDDASHWLEKENIVADRERLLAIGGGAPLRALRAAEEAWLDADARLIDQLAVLKQRRGNPLQVVEEWNDRPITQVFDSLKRCVVDLVRLASSADAQGLYHPAQRAELQSLGQGIDLELLYGLNDEILQMDRDSTNNLNPQMMLEHIANHWLRITRSGGR